MEKQNVSQPLEVVVVGAGERSELYATYQDRRPDQLKVVGVVDPNEVRRKRFISKFDIPEENSFDSLEEFLRLQENLGAAIFNGTMDHLHVPTTIPLIERGYHILLEKPIGISKKEINKLQEAAIKHKVKILICHVLRYSPFYAEMKRRIHEGEIGKVLNIQTSEHVSYHHMAAAYIRGKWNSEEKCGSSILMAKSCHDLDLITWFKSGVKAPKISSYGSLMYFKPEHAPKGSGTRCLTDCKIERECPFSAKKQYIDKGMWNHYVWGKHEKAGRELTVEEKEKILKEISDFGKCVWRSDNDVYDHQSVLIEFEDGTTATHNLVGGSPKGDRTIHIIGSEGEILGKLSEGRFTIRKINLDVEGHFEEETVDVSILNDMHGGGDYPLVEDFVAIMRGGKPSLSTTTLADSIQGHLIGFKADELVKEQRKY